MDAVFYFNFYKMGNFNPKNILNIIKDLERDFIVDLKKCQVTDGCRSINPAIGYKTVPFNHFKTTVYKLLHIIAQLKTWSNGTFNADIVWRHIFRGRILRYAIYEECFSKSFLELEYNFSPKTESTKSPPKLLSVTEECMLFMGLKTGFKKAELLRRFRKLSLEFHPDKGGKHENFVKLQECRAILESFC